MVADYVVHGAVVRDSFENSLAQFEALRESGVGTVKIFSAYTDSIGLTLDQIRRVFAAAADAGITVFVHAETDSLVRDGIEQAARTFDLGPRAHARSRTPIAESDAVDVICDLARAMGAAIYFVHISGAGSVASLAERKGRGDTIVAETCPHYLFLDESVYDRPAGHRWICSPPLRSAADRAALWDGLRQGVIDTVSSDHNCFDNAQKDAGATDFRQVPNGLPGVETRLPLLVGAAIEGRIDWARLVQVVSEAPARVIGLWPRKGTLAVGADADIALIDPAGNTDLGSGHMSTDFWPFEGVRSSGSLAAVYRRGERVVSDGRLSATPGSGSWLPIGREGQPGVAPRATS